MTIGILGGGIAALSLATFLDEDTVIFEKENELGGLCRSFNFGDLTYDIGPHIVFSKHEEVLAIHNSMVEMNVHQRLNRVLVKGSLVKYPFENFLGSLPAATNQYCLDTFLHNDYSTLPVTNMQQFFLQKFGEGMTDEYFSPYNKKIWKLDPSYLDLQMVERIPSPPREDVITGSQGVPREGYSHQLTFTYPKSGGFQSLVNAYESKLVEKNTTQIHRGFQIQSCSRVSNRWSVQAIDGRQIEVDRLISTIPLPNLPDTIHGTPDEIKAIASQMMYNSIHIVILRFKGDKLTDQFALYVPDEDIIFHRLSRLNFLGDEYGNGSDYFNVMLEVTFRPGSPLSKLPDSEIITQCLRGLERLGIAPESDFVAGEVRTFDHAYVIYDINHRSRTDKMLDWANDIGVICHGRFGKFEYQNSDQVVFDSIQLAKKLNDKE